MAINTSNSVSGNNNWTSAVNPESTAAASTKKSSSMDMQGFLKLMAAQMQNQSLTSQTDDSQYITEMTLFTAIQAMNTQTAESNKQYAASLVGSDVLIKTIDKTTGNAKEITGTVSKAVFNTSSSDSTIEVGGQTYSLSDVAEVYGYHGTSDTAARQYAASLVGKNVVVQTTDSDGVTHKSAGEVQQVSFDPSTGASTLTMAGNHTYNVSDVIEVDGNQSTDIAAARQYAASLVGKTVEVQTTGSDGVVHKEDGTVQSVSFDPTSGIAMLNFDNNHTYNVSDVIEVLKT